MGGSDSMAEGSLWSLYGPLISAESTEIVFVAKARTHRCGGLSETHVEGTMVGHEDYSFGCHSYGPFADCDWDSTVAGKYFGGYASCLHVQQRP